MNTMKGKVRIHAMASVQKKKNRIMKDREVYAGDTIETPSCHLRFIFASADWWYHNKT